jgi:hypothetical protein
MSLNDKLHFITTAGGFLVHYIKIVVISVSHNLRKFPYLNRSVH